MLNVMDVLTSTICHKAVNVVLGNVVKCLEKKWLCSSTCCIAVSWGKGMLLKSASSSSLDDARL